MKQLLLLGRSNNGYLPENIARAFTREKDNSSLRKNYPSLYFYVVNQAGREGDWAIRDYPD
jgi:hypothetical protein